MWRASSASQYGLSLSRYVTPVTVTGHCDRICGYGWDMLEVVPVPPTPEEIRALRQAANWTQEGAARALHVTLRTYTRWERGESAMQGGLWELMQIKARDQLDGDAGE